MHNELAMALGLQYDSIASFFLARRVHHGSNSPQSIEKRKLVESDDLATGGESSGSRPRKIRKQVSSSILSEIMEDVLNRYKARKSRSRSDERREIEQEDSSHHTDTPARRPRRPFVGRATKATSHPGPEAQTPVPTSAQKEPDTELRRAQRRARNAEIVKQYPPPQAYP